MVIFHQENIGVCVIVHEEKLQIIQIMLNHLLPLITTPCTGIFFLHFFYELSCH